MNPYQRLARLFVLTCVAVLAPAGDASAATYTWTGSGGLGNPDWFSSGLTLNSNWNPSGGTLGPGDSLVFGNSPSQFLNQNGNAQITHLIFTGYGNGYYLDSSSSSVLTISGSLVQEDTIRNLATINNPVQFVTGAVVNTQEAGIQLNVLTGSGNFTKIGAWDLGFTNASTYSGTMTISEGSVFADFFGGSIVNNGGFFQLLSPWQAPMCRAGARRCSAAPVP